MKEFPWSDNWWIENNKAWFVLGEQNFLCCYDLMRQECELMINIPDRSKEKFKLTSSCIKYKNDIYCMPVRGSSIWVYRIEYKTFSEIKVGNLHQKEAQIYDFWEFEGKIYAVSIGLKQIFELNTTERRAENCYVLCREGSIARSVKAGASIYCLSGMSEKIYGFNLITKEVIIYELPNIGRRFNTLSFDGHDFWLGGYYKEIYAWNREKNIINTYSDFPVGFGTYSFTEDTDGEVDCNKDGFEVPAFLYSTIAGKFIWFIPFQTNKILYVNRENHEIHAFEIAEEVENRESLINRTDYKGKYILEYVKDSRYLGVFSIRNCQIVEIDAVRLTYKWCDYDIGARGLKEYVRLMNKAFYEGNTWDRKVYNKILHLEDNQVYKIDKNDIGINIYEGIKEN